MGKLKRCGFCVNRKLSFYFNLLGDFIFRVGFLGTGLRFLRLKYVFVHKSPTKLFNTQKPLKMRLRVVNCTLDLCLLRKSQGICGMKLAITYAP